MQKNVDEILVKVLDSVAMDQLEVDIQYSDGDHYVADGENDSLRFPCIAKGVDNAYCGFGEAEVVVLEISYLKNGAVVGSSLIQYDSCELRLLKYKVELPRGAKVTLFDDAALEAKYLAWNIPCPTSFPNMTFLQVKAANGFEQQLTPSAGSQAIELYTELGRRYAVFGEIWTYSYEQTLWFADLAVQLADDSWINCIPTAGEGGTIVTALPQ